MLHVAHSLRELSFGKLMEVYIEGNREKAEECWPALSAGEGLLRAEQDFYQYLQEGFFSEKGAAYYVWEVNGAYVSALRLESYRDGLLLEALETVPEYRQQGYAKALILAVLEQHKGQAIYSHVGKKNTASLRAHLACGFQKVADLAVYADGSVNDRCYTLKIM